MYVHPDTGLEMTFPEIVTAVLIEEDGMSEKDAQSLVTSYPKVMINGMMAGRGREYRATAMALRMAAEAESEVSDEQ